MGEETKDLIDTLMHKSTARGNTSWQRTRDAIAWHPWHQLTAYWRTDWRLDGESTVN
jgi:hypothetical protein